MTTYRESTDGVMVPTQAQLLQKVTVRLGRKKPGHKVSVTEALTEALRVDRELYDGEVFHQGLTPRSSARRALYGVLAIGAFIVRDQRGVVRVRFEVVAAIESSRSQTAQDLLAKCQRNYGAILADPPWRFTNRSGKVAPEHQRLARYRTMDVEEIMQLPVGELAAPKSHLYLWVPNALLETGLAVMRAWGFQYKTNLPWYKVRRDGGPDGRGVGFYFRNVTEVLLFGVKGKLRTLAPGRRQVNIIVSRKREHSRKPDEQYPIIQSCSPGPFLELFARASWPGWDAWGDQAPQVAGSQAVIEVI